MSYYDDHFAVKIERKVITHGDGNRVSKAFICVCLCVCVVLFVCLIVRMITQKTNDPKVFKIGVGNDLAIAYRWFWVKRSKVKVTGSQSAKHIEGDRVADVSYALFRVSSL